MKKLKIIQVEHHTSSSCFIFSSLSCVSCVIFSFRLVISFLKLWLLVVDVSAVPKHITQKDRNAPSAILGLILSFPFIVIGVVVSTSGRTIVRSNRAIFLNFGIPVNKDKCWAEMRDDTDQSVWKITRSGWYHMIWMLRALNDDILWYLLNLNGWCWWGDMVGYHGAKVGRGGKKTQGPVYLFTYVPRKLGLGL